MTANLQAAIFPLYGFITDNLLFNFEIILEKFSFENV